MEPHTETLKVKNTWNVQAKKTKINVVKVESLRRESKEEITEINAEPDHVASHRVYIVRTRILLSIRQETNR